MADTAK
jgi:hypothetical protein